LVYLNPLDFDLSYSDILPYVVKAVHLSVLLA